MFLKLKIFKYLLIYRFRKEFKTREALETWQNKKIKKHLKRVVKKSSFYSERLQKYNSWTAFPIINKKIFMDNFDAINTHGIEKEAAFEVAIKGEQTRNFSPMIKNITIGLSSGTSGNRGIFMVSIKERAQWVAYVVLNLLGFKFKKRKIAFFLRANSNLYTSAKSRLIDFNFFDLKKPLKENILSLNKYNPDILIAQPSMLREIAKAQQEKTINIKPSKIISVAEVLEPIDHSLLKRTFNQVIHQAYQCTEGFLAKTCRYGTLHFNEDLVKIEQHFLDSNKDRYHPIITDFTRSSQPIFRYELNDIIIDKQAPCPCGSIFKAIDHIEGRSDDTFVLESRDGKSVNIFPDFIRRTIIITCKNIKEYIVEQSGDKEITIYLDSQNFESAKTLLEEAFINLLKHYNVDDCSLIFKPEVPICNTSKLRRVKRNIKQ